MIKPVCRRGLRQNVARAAQLPRAANKMCLTRGIPRHCRSSRVLLPLLRAGGERSWLRRPLCAQAAAAADADAPPLSKRQQKKLQQQQQQGGKGGGAASAVTPRSEDFGRYQPRQQPWTPEIPLLLDAVVAGSTAAGTVCANFGG